MNDHVLDALELPETLRHRILCRVSPAPSEASKRRSFVLYLPTVVLRKRHNPAFALACRLANQYHVPLVVLCTVLDDQHLSRKPLNPVCMTARRLAFTLEALQSCTKEWEAHGAGVVIRVHGPGSRNPHHLSLIHKSTAVVSDEPFVEPFRTYLRNVVITSHSAKVPCFTVDGSTTVPPNSMLKLAADQSISGDLMFTGVPLKAWIWEKQTNVDRKAQVYAATRSGFFNAPDLDVKLTKNFILEDEERLENAAETSRIVELMPSRWKSKDVPCPGLRPWTVAELCSISNLKEWAMKEWPGADISVPPCKQTHGSFAAAEQRWQSFLDHGLKDYAKRRNQIVLPHAVSRSSCYLNLGVLSIFDVVQDVWEAKAERKGYSAGCAKFLDEVVKWREIGYAHTFASPRYHTGQAIPNWARAYLGGMQCEEKSSGYDYRQLESAGTQDETWNAMQTYLVETGELHNNARMTWGKTVVHWQATMVSPEEVLWQLCTLNDRFALDGMSPPSYAGLLWCFGWGDKAWSGGSVSTKWAHRYRTKPDGFEQAKENLFSGFALSHAFAARETANARPTKKLRLEEGNSASWNTQSKTILSFFSPTPKAEPVK